MNKDIMKRSRCMKVVETALMNLEFEAKECNSVEDEFDGAGKVRKLEGEVKAGSSETGGVFKKFGDGDVLMSPSVTSRMSVIRRSTRSALKVSRTTNIQQN